MDIDPKYLADWSGLTRGTPAQLHRPRSTEEVSELVSRCAEAGRRITVQGGLTGLAGGAVPGDGDVVINLERMNAIEGIDELEGIMTVQAGATLEQVQNAAREAGWFFPVDLGARGSCQVGGNAATNAGGDRVLRYGTMRDSILGIEAVLPDGSVLDSMTQLVKNSAPTMPCRPPLNRPSNLAWSPIARSPPACPTPRTSGACARAFPSCCRT